MKLASEAAAHGDKIVELENLADDVKRNIRLNLPRCLFMPESLQPAMRALVEHAIRPSSVALEALNPIDVIFLYRVIDWIGDLADKSQTVGNRMLYLIAR